MFEHMILQILHRQRICVPSASYGNLGHPDARVKSLRNLGNYPIVPAPNGESTAATGRCGTSPTSRDIRFGSHMCRLADTEGRDFQI
jgi:hypothetical protein